MHAGTLFIIIIFFIFCCTSSYSTRKKARNEFASRDKYLLGRQQGHTHQEPKQGDRSVITTIQEQAKWTAMQTDPNLTFVSRTRLHASNVVLKAATRVLMAVSICMSTTGCEMGRESPTAASS